MTKAGLVRILQSKDPRITRTKATETIDSILEVLKSKIASGERVLITNFGSFEVLSRKERRGRNPATGEIINIHPRRTVVLRTARKLEEAIN